MARQAHTRVVIINFISYFMRDVSVFLRMLFGILFASETMQKRNEETFEDINGVHVIADDLTVAA